MSDAAEITPGLYIVDGRLTICPGCGLEADGLDPFDPDHVRDWCKGAFAALKEVGVPECTQEEAEEFAARYLKERWHESE